MRTIEQDAVFAILEDQMAQWVKRTDHRSSKSEVEIARRTYDALRVACAKLRELPVYNVCEDKG